MKKLRYILILLSACASFMFIDNVSALDRVFDNLEIGVSGAIYDNRSDTYSVSLGYVSNSPSIGANNYANTITTTSDLQTIVNSWGATISQCGLSFVENGYYSMTYFFWNFNSSDLYYSPNYSSKTYKVGITSAISSTTNFNPTTSDYGVNTYPNYGYMHVSYYTIIFKAPNTGTCINSAFSTNKTYNFSASQSTPFHFLGYKFEYLGDKALTTNEIQDALSGQFDSINSSINQGNATINNNINDLKEKQEEQNQTSKGIWQSLKDGINSIGQWFSSLGESLGEFAQYIYDGFAQGFGDLFTQLSQLPHAIWDIFSGGFSAITEAIGTGLSDLWTSIKDTFGSWFTDLWNNIKSLFFGEKVETCNTITNYFLPITTKYSRITSSFSNFSVPLDSDGYFTLETNGQVLYYTGVHTYLKPNHKYRLYIEFGSLSVNTSVEINQYYPDGKVHLFGAHGKTFKQNDKFGYFDLTTGPNPPPSYGFEIMFQNGSGVTGYNKSKLRMMLIDIDDVEKLGDYEYFKENKTICEDGGNTGGLFDSLTNFKDSVGGWFNNLLTGLLDGIKALLVPTDDQLLEIIDDSSELSENFGFVGESIAFFLNIFTVQMGLVNSNGCVQLPEFSIGSTSLFDSHVFWESKNVCLNDNVILSSNISTIRTITSIVLVGMFINFASKKFFTILSKEESEES